MACVDIGSTDCSTLSSHVENRIVKTLRTITLGAALLFAVPAIAQTERPADPQPRNQGPMITDEETQEVIIETPNSADGEAHVMIRRNDSVLFDGKGKLELIQKELSAARAELRKAAAELDADKELSGKALELRKKALLEVERILEGTDLKNLQIQHGTKQQTLEMEQSFNISVTPHSSEDVRRLTEEIEKSVEGTLGGSKNVQVRVLKSRNGADATIDVRELSGDSAQSAVLQMDSLLLANNPNGEQRVLEIRTTNDNGLEHSMVIINPDSSNSHVAIGSGNCRAKCTATEARRCRKMIDSNGNNVTIVTREDRSPMKVMVRSNGKEGVRKMVMVNITSDSSVARTDATNQARTFTIDGNDQVLVTSDSAADGARKRVMIRVENGKREGPRTKVLVVTSAKEKAGTTAASAEAAPNVNTATTIEKTVTSATAEGYSLDANVPNPFHGFTTINFSIPADQHATLTVFNSAGETVQVLKDEEMKAGKHSVTFNASDLPSGTYLYRLVSGGFNATKTMTVTK